VETARKRGEIRGGVASGPKERTRGTPRRTRPGGLSQRRLSSGEEHRDKGPGRGGGLGDVGGGERDAHRSRWKVRAGADVPSVISWGMQRLCARGGFGTVWISYLESGGYTRLTSRGCTEETVPHRRPLLPPSRSYDITRAGHATASVDRRLGLDRTVRSYYPLSPTTMTTWIPSSSYLGTA